MVPEPGIEEGNTMLSPRFPDLIVVCRGVTGRKNCLAAHKGTSCVTGTCRFHFS